MEYGFFRVADPHNLIADPDPAFHLMWTRIQLFTLILIRIRILIKVMIIF
jgi:hypothetical protein